MLQLDEGADLVLERDILGTTVVQVVQADLLDAESSSSCGRIGVESWHCQSHRPWRDLYPVTRSHLSSR
jgi:hypothetical protein